MRYNGVLLHSNGVSVHAQGLGQSLELTNPRLTPQDRQAVPPPGLPKFRASGEPILPPKVGRAQPVAPALPDVCL